MITEIATVEIKPGTEQEFEAAVEKASAISGVPGNYGVQLHRSIQNPTRYRVMSRWESVAHHHAFRDSPQAQEYFALVGPFLMGTPEVEHTETVLATF
ncbi:antibiotic biosynthesis monooxygenase family protein [Sphingobium subterraneum]|uniref:Quinol monooxygenase YgiN n=1 Tax=Sphingobium subterraneum TaxID=627688 RepID=A0A841J271_9SPHN|nr:antibiotic biosynthesis monooxygenase family protein [Sphingobium subterraneum]MBB6122735.1 quinol monooxygenase YgiN [Sphingobium subterraneum]